MKFDKGNIAHEPQWVSKAFVLLTLLISTLSAFLFGCATRIHHQFAESAKFDAINNNIAPWTKDQSKLIVMDKLSNVSTLVAGDSISIIAYLINGNLTY